jgi:FkbM family methyltransferase
MNLRTFLRRCKLLYITPLIRSVFVPRSLNSNVYSEIRKKGLSNPDIDIPLPEFYSQCGEDMIVQAYLKALAIRYELDLSTFTVCEIGANHPIAFSSTYLLAKSLKLKVLLVEANPHLIPDLRRTRPESTVVNAAVSDQTLDEITFYISNQSEISSLDPDFVETWNNSAVGLKTTVKCPALRYNDLVEKYAGGIPAIFLAMDIEGVDYKVLVDSDLEKYGPLVFQIEASDYEGEKSNLRAMMGHLSANGYELYAKTTYNAIFIKADTQGWLKKFNRSA